MNFIRNLFAPTVESLTAPLAKTVARLERHADVQDRKAEQLFDQADAIERQAAERVQESLRAARQARKFRELLA